ncbi:uncharacterized protein FA14DRAFT_152708 [Meira miltonrushii]|uniref:F-box domain-containing protein n=1 Tax=Meira miltonrushii TaxID=1280837 RepID=A0A316VIE2_9BASI|nr:uncharacterized protein FA14DRAFT_152708 [Meira miltonrushii]PWN37306.1 hypothetical protein FA14DRAFT_152708 [Meira miltonrushii]
MNFITTLQRMRPYTLVPTDEEQQHLEMIRYSSEDESDDKETRVPELPVEILHRIFKHYLLSLPEIPGKFRPWNSESKEICRLSQVNHTFQAFFKPLLWKRVCIFGADEEKEKIKDRSCCSCFQVLIQQFRKVEPTEDYSNDTWELEHKARSKHPWGVLGKSRTLNRSCGRNVKGISWTGPGRGTFYESDINLSKLSIPLIDSTVESISVENGCFDHDICNYKGTIDWLEDDPGSQFGFRVKHKEDNEQPTFCYWLVQQCMIGAEHSLKEVNFDYATPPLTIPALYPLWVYFERVGSWFCPDVWGTVPATDYTQGIAWLRRLLLRYEGPREGAWIQDLLVRECEAIKREEQADRHYLIEGPEGPPYQSLKPYQVRTFLQTLGFRYLNVQHDSLGFGLVGDMDSSICANLAKVVERLKKEEVTKKNECLGSSVESTFKYRDLI